MFYKRLVRIIKKEFLHFFRDKNLLPMVLIMPLIQMLAFGYVLSSQVKHLPTAVFDSDHTSSSRQIVRQFSNSEYFDINYYASSDKEAQNLLDSGNVQTVINIPKGFASKKAAGKTADLQLIVDGSDSKVAMMASSYGRMIINQQSIAIQTRSFKKTGLTEGIPSIEARIRTWFNPAGRNVDYMIPGLIAFILMLSSMNLTSQALVKEKDMGTLEQLIVTPIRKSELILGKIIPYICIALLQITVILVFGIFYFGVPFRGSILLLYLMSLIFLMTSLGMGLFISAISNNRPQAMLTTMFFMIPAMLLSGFMFPIENMPKPIYLITYLIPLRYFLVIVRAIFLKGAGIMDFWPQVVALIIFGVAILSLSILKFQKRLD